MPNAKFEMLKVPDTEQMPNVGIGVTSGNVYEIMHAKIATEAKNIHMTRMY